jgi:hypothetical protein
MASPSPTLRAVRASARWSAGVAGLVYPAQVYLDQSAGIADDERTFDLGGLVPLH